LRRPRSAPNAGAAIARSAITGDEFQSWGRYRVPGRRWGHSVDTSSGVSRS
jgi:hypothetical protein